MGSRSKLPQAGKPTPFDSLGKARASAINNHFWNSHETSVPYGIKNCLVSFHLDPNQGVIRLLDVMMKGKTIKDSRQEDLY